MGSPDAPRGQNTDGGKLMALIGNCGDDEAKAFIGETETQRCNYCGDKPNGVWHGFTTVFCCSPCALSSALQLSVDAYVDRLGVNGVSEELRFEIMKKVRITILREIVGHIEKGVQS